MMSFSNLTYYVNVILYKEICKFIAEGSWTCGGTAGVRQETISSPGAAPASTPATQQTPAYRAILPSFVRISLNDMLFVNRRLMLTIIIFLYS